MKNVSQKSGKPNRQSERTKSWIFDALMQIMDNKPYNKITVSDITKKAGIARTTFYRNYKDIDDIVFEYINNMFKTELLSKEKSDDDKKQNTILIKFDHLYLNKNQKNLRKILSTADIENRIFRYMLKYPIFLVEQYKKQFSEDEYFLCRFKICYQITGSIRVIFDWFINKLPRTIENLILMINTTNNPENIKYKNFPNIIFQLKEQHCS